MGKVRDGLPSRLRILSFKSHFSRVNPAKAKEASDPRLQSFQKYGIEGRECPTKNSVNCFGNECGKSPWRSPGQGSFCGKEATSSCKIGGKGKKSGGAAATAVSKLAVGKEA